MSLTRIVDRFLKCSRDRIDSTEAKLAFELQIVVLDRPAHLGGGDKLLEGAEERQDLRAGLQVEKERV